MSYLIGAIDGDCWNRDGRQPSFWIIISVPGAFSLFFMLPLSSFLPSPYCCSLGTLHERLRSFSRRLLIYYEQSISLGWNVSYFYTLIVSQIEYVLHRQWKHPFIYLYFVCACMWVYTLPSRCSTTVSTTRELFNQMGLMRWTWKPFGKGTLIRMCVLNLLKLIKKLIKHLTI